MAKYFKDRVAQFPGRVTMTPVSGQPNTYDMARAEGTVTEEGTPFNADTFNDIANTIHAFGTCTTSASVRTKVVTCPGFVLHEGAKISVLFENINTVHSPRLNVNGTGEKYIATAIGDGTVVDRSRMWSDNEVVDFVYAGDHWVIVNPALTNIEMLLLENRLTGIPTDQTRLYGILNAIIDKTVANKAGTRVILSSYTGGSIYTFPSDGYLTTRAASTATDRAFASVLDANGSAIGDVGAIAGSSFPVSTMFVRKGMQVTVTALAGSGSVHFTPLNV